jgi:hypothetical protein
MLPMLLDNAIKAREKVKLILERKISKIGSYKQKPYNMYISIE